MAEAFGADRPAAVCRELTKTHEEVRRGALGELAAWAAHGPVLGEVTLVVAGAPPAAADPEELVAQVLARVEAGERVKDAARAVAGAHHVPGRDLYAAAVAARRPGSRERPVTARD
jgi:16S rRNA (cytidine1402-2'-O)-methyltransferase